MKKLFCLLTFIIFSAGVSAQGVPAGGMTNNAYSKSKITSRIISAVDHTWGYEIWVDSVLLIHQPSVPGLEGNRGFRMKADALRVADQVITKIRAGIFPPTITREELVKLHVTLN